MVVRAVLGAFAVAAALGAVGAGISRREPALAAVAVIVAFVWGVVAGLFLLRALPSLPPTTALDRFLVILLPVALAIEAEAAAHWLGGFWLTVERGCVALVAVPVLLHGSVWLEGGGPAAAILAASLFFWASWEGITGEVRASDDRVVAGVTVLALVVAGLSIAMAGWLKGGLVALPLAGALAGALAAEWGGSRAAGGSLGRDGGGPAPSGLPGLTAAGLVALFGLVVVGRCFGRLGSAAALLILLVPLLAVVPAAIGRGLPVSAAGRLLCSASYRIFLAVVPLVIVLWGAKADFDTRLGRLLGAAPAAARHRAVSPRPVSARPISARLVSARLVSARLVSPRPELQAVPAFEFGRDRLGGEVASVKQGDFWNVGGKQAAENDPPARCETAAELVGMRPEHRGDDVGEDEVVGWLDGKLVKGG